MRSNFEKRYRNKYSDFLVFLFAILLTLIFGHNDFSQTKFMLWATLLTGAAWYVIKTSKPENVYHIRVDVDEKKINKAEYDKNVHPPK